MTDEMWCEVDDLDVLVKYTLHEAEKPVLGRWEDGHPGEAAWVEIHSCSEDLDAGQIESVKIQIMEAGDA